ncbi:TPA: hypothetical protein N0F65_012426 [Lagenidium giganteum]|uniref:RanBP2-type domain-containing protein n=1 Tax=Lagenidium giganteum TaxID=4803 RepID=A0AAV2YPI2_9STRA|nr:TPA: hypothetical protein N0F65_012426 [Lagenidium giganteum]
MHMGDRHADANANASPSVTMTTPARDNDTRRRLRARGSARTDPYAQAAQSRRRQRTLTQRGYDDASASANAAPKSFLSKMFSYIPIVGKLVQDLDDDDEFDDAAWDDDAMLDGDDRLYARSSSEGSADEEDAAMAEAEENHDDKRSNQKAAANPVRTQLSPKEVKKPKVAPKAINTRSAAVDGEEKSLTPVKKSPKKPFKASSPAKSKETKALVIEKAAEKENGELKRKESSTGNARSPMTVIKQRRTITFEEYEKLSQQLRGLVEPTPEAALGMVQGALANGAHDRSTAKPAAFPKGPSMARSTTAPSTDSAYVPGSVALRATGADANGRSTEEVSEMRFGKRARSNGSQAIVFSGSAQRNRVLSREERLERRPKPSRLLTGAKRDALARSAHSASIAEKVLLTLNKMQSPLETEAKKPTPSTSVSWAKYHLAMAQDTPSSNGAASAPDAPLPPTTTIPKVAFASSTTSGFGQANGFTTKPAPAVEQPKAAGFSFGSSTSTSNLVTPSVKPKAPSVTPLFSPPDVSMTPAVPAPKPTAAAPALVEKPLPPKKTSGKFQFTLPVTKSTVKVKNDDGIQYVFSPPPEEREPPKKVSSTHKKATLAGQQPFDFAASSPKSKPSFALGKKADKPVAAAAPKPKPAAPAAPAAPAPAAPTPAAAGGAVNPLLRFMQTAPGSWKCPSCAVTNGPEHTKCPCCETDKPGGSEPAKAKEPEKKAAPGAITSSGFSFGAPAADAKPAESAKPSFSFGFSASSDDSKPPTKTSGSTGFTFGAAPAAPAAPAAASFTFGATAAKSSTTSADSTSSSSKEGFTFGTSSKRKADDSDSGADKATKLPAFGSDSAKPVDNKGTAAPSTTGFSFGATTASKDLSKTTESATPSFSFGTPATSTLESSAAATKPATGFTFGAGLSSKSTPAPEVAKPTFTFGSSEKKAETPAVTTSSEPKAGGLTFGQTQATPAEDKDTTAKPAFSFGAATSSEPKKNAESVNKGSSFGAAASKPDTAEKKDAPQPAFSFGATASKASESTEGAAAKPATATPSFTFGSSAPASKSDDASATKPAAAAATKPGFTFGSTPAPAGKTPAFSGDSASSATSKPGFTFGQSNATADKPAAAAKPAFTFGDSGDKPAAASSGGFGSSSGSSGAAFTFGSSAAPAAASKEASSSTFAFGSSSANPSTTTTFGPAASSGGFGQTAPAASTTFGASSGGFGQSSSTFGSSASSGFGSSAPQPATTSFGFGGSSQPPSTSPSPGFGFGSSSTPAPAAPSSATPSFGFGASTPAPAFGAAAPASNGFGSQPAPAFGSASASSGGFGASSGTTFGAPAFGAPAQPPAPAFGAPQPAATGFGAPAASAGAFGAPAAAPTTSFGASSGFGAPSTTFGAAPAASSGFGAQPTPAFGAVDASQGGGFNVGAAPQQAPKGRRILKAKLKRPVTMGDTNAATAAAAAVSIGNYKGVMLCNRPFNGVAACTSLSRYRSPFVADELMTFVAAMVKDGRSGGNYGSGGNNNNAIGGGSDVKAAFLAGIPAEPIGMNVPIYSEPMHAVKRDKKNTALSKHKKWLHELQKERARLQELLMEDEENKRKRSERFAQREAKFRESVRQNQPEADAGDESMRADKKLSRPMWALTKQTAEEKADMLQDAEADDLIDFANNLDIDQFMDDVEVKARVAQVEQQLAQVQSIVAYEEAEEKRADRDQAREDGGKVVALNANDLAKWDRLSAKGGSPDDDTMSVASSVLSECKSIRSVHSVRSVAALTKRAEAKLADGSTSEAGVALNPKIVTIDEEEGSRMQIKHLASNLPYIHRNPAI